MIGDAAKAVFPHVIDVRYFVTITWDICFTFWACDNFNRFDGMKKTGVIRHLDLSFQVTTRPWVLEGLYSTVVFNTNTTMTYYGKSGISLWYVFWITGTDGREMYEAFFPDNNVIIEYSLPKSLGKLFQIWGCLYIGKSQPKFIAWFKEAILEQLDVALCRNMGLHWRFWGLRVHCNPNIELENYWVVF